MLKMISIAAMAMAATAANAAPITYNVNQIMGLGSVIGTIQTNGNLGTLTNTDVLGFDLVVSGPGASVELTNNDSVVVTQGSNFTASAKSLFFNYSGTSSFLLFQFSQFGTGQKYYCNASVSGTCFQGASAVPESYNSPSVSVEIRAGNQIIGSAVPEPATWALLVLGFASVGVAVRRKSAAVAA